MFIFKLIISLKVLLIVILQVYASLPLAYQRIDCCICFKRFYFLCFFNLIILLTFLNRNAFKVESKCLTELIFFYQSHEKDDFLRLTAVCRALHQSLIEAGICVKIMESMQLFWKKWLIPIVSCLSR